VALIGATASLALAGCGGPEQDPEEVLDRAFGQSIGSAQMRLSVDVDLEGIPGAEEPTSIQLEGPYESGDERTLPSFDLAASVDSGSLPAPAGAVRLVSTGDNFYLELAGNAYEAGRDAIRSELEARRRQQGEEDSNPFGVDPRSWLVDPSIEGTEELDGVETTHVTAAISVPAMIDDLNEAASEAAAAGDQTAPVLTEEQIAQIEEVVQNPVFDLYAGEEDGKIRRLTGALDFQVPEADRAALGGLSGGRVSFELTFTDVGQPVEISAPEDARPIEDLAKEMQALSGGLVPGAAGGEQDGGGATVPPVGTAPEGTQPPAGAGDQESFQEYADCLAKADPNDAAALADCTELLGG
jgi:hypothetical protein